ncbi:MAG: 1-(5-phosphoribosyl)-5-[(5-phosphoribosylamino)methylideneamino]imidazole-4-carboxamide isomerase [Lachnospiraceae bacterium]|nr:1-(5-phosphoribosyl)-5-[(5-phosphoribosylamino)methylideneamino]imidazole-4-carboxamide isomerase [Lachnospiraceae bacterium]
MILYPAIDIRNGQCVRLRQGQFHDEEVYSHIPSNVAALWESLGASHIHVVDLDGALAGHSVNEDVIREIVQRVKVPVQTGGGIRSLSDVEHKLSLGVERVIIGTKAVESPQFIKELIASFGPEKIIVGIDAKNGMVATEGWEKVSSHNAVSLALMMKEIGVKTIVYTDISKDGMLCGPNIEHTKEMVEATGLNVIASGGVSCMKDLDDLSRIGVGGAIIGKALYEKRIGLRDAIAQYEK